MNTLDDRSLDILFRNARTHSAWLPKQVPDELLKQVYDIAKMGATSANSSPMRVVFVKSPEAKEKLKPVLDAGNVAKTMAAPATAIIGQDMEFYEKLPFLFPHTDARIWFAGKKEKIAETAFRNSTLQGAYFMLAARALGLDCGPMSGFDNEKMDAIFFAGTNFRSNFICNLGYGDSLKPYPRNPRLSFDETCKIE